MDARRLTKRLAGRVVARVVRTSGSSLAAPAETDIAGHFLVSAPSVNQMIKTLERRGYITRRRDVYGQALPRSTQLVADA